MRLAWGLLWALLAQANKDVRLCDSDSPGAATPAYTAFIRSLYDAGLSTLPTQMPDNCNEFDTLNDIADMFNPLASVPGMQGADFRGRYAYCRSIHQNALNAGKGVGLTVSWPEALPQTYLDYSQPPPPYITQTLALDATPTQPHDFQAKTFRTTLWTSVYLRPPDGQVSPSFEGDEWD
jgi:hypothetical protein